MVCAKDEGRRSALSAPCLRITLVKLIGPKGANVGLDAAGSEGDGVQGSEEQGGLERSGVLVPGARSETRYNRRDNQEQQTLPTAMARIQLSK